MEKRKKYIEILRGISAIGVIFIHVSSNNWYGYIGSFNWIVFTIYTALARNAVPIFFMISGALFLDDKRENSLFQMLKKYVFKLSIFLIFWSFVYKIGWSIHQEGSWVQKLLTAGKEILQGDTQIHLWYIYAIVGLYLLTPYLQVMCKNMSKKQLRSLLVVCFIFSSFCQMCAYIPKLDFIVINLNKISAGSGVGYIGFYLLGHYIDKYDFEKEKRAALYIAGGIGSLLTIFLVIYDCMTQNAPSERFWVYTMPWIVISSMAIFVLFKNMKKYDGKLAGILKVVASKSLGIYGMHMIFVFIFWKLGFTTFSFPGIFSVPVISLCVLLMSMAAVWVIEKIPVINKYII